MIKLRSTKRFQNRSHEEESRSQMIQKALSRAKLDHLVERWGLEMAQDWRPVLSPGEQQRVAFARLFLELSNRRPNETLAVLDEATGNVDYETECKLYEELRKELLPGGGLAGFVSVGHRSTLWDYHDTALLIGPGLEQLGRDETSIESGDWVCPDANTTPWRHVRTGIPAASDGLSQSSQSRPVNPQPKRL